MNIREIKELIRLLDESEIAEFMLEESGTKLQIRKGVVAPIPSVQAFPASAPQPLAPAPQEVPSEAAPPESDGRYTQIVAPMVGTFYRAPAPDAEPYVKPGDLIDVGQTLCIIEAMKLMNEIESEVKGRISRILVENGQPVEYGQPLFLVEEE